MGKIKGWRKLRASDYGLSSWVANEGKDNETILALRRGQNNNAVKIVRKNNGSKEGTVLVDQEFNSPYWAYQYAINYMEIYPFGYPEASYYKGMPVVSKPPKGFHKVEGASAIDPRYQLYAKGSRFSGEYKRVVVPKKR